MLSVALVCSHKYYHIYSDFVISPTEAQQVHILLNPHQYIHTVRCWANSWGGRSLLGFMCVCVCVVHVILYGAPRHCGLLCICHRPLMPVVIFAGHLSHSQTQGCLSGLLTRGGNVRIR